MPSRRDQIKLTEAEQRDLIDTGRIVVVSSHGPRGWPHVMPLWYVPRDGEVWIWTYAKSQKVRNLERQVMVAQSQLDAVNQRITTAQDQQQAVTKDRSLSPTDRLLAILNLNSVIATGDARRTALQAQLYNAQQLLTQARDVEESRVVEPAAAAKSTARSNRTSLIVGGLIGLLVGAIAALVVEPIAARRRAATSG